MKSHLRHTVCAGEIWSWWLLGVINWALVNMGPCDSQPGGLTQWILLIPRLLHKAPHTLHSSGQMQRAGGNCPTVATEKQGKHEHPGQHHTSHQPHTDHMPTTYWPHTNHIIPTAYQPHTNHILTTYQPHTTCISTTYQPNTNHILTKPTKHQPHIDHILTVLPTPKTWASPRLEQHKTWWPSLGLWHPSSGKQWVCHALCHQLLLTESGHLSTCETSDLELGTLKTSQVTQKVWHFRFSCPVGK